MYYEVVVTTSRHHEGGRQTGCSVNEKNSVSARVSCFRFLKQTLPNVLRVFQSSFIRFQTVLFPDRVFGYKN